MYIRKIAVLRIDKCFPVGTWNKSQAKIMLNFASFKFISPPWSGFTLTTQLKMLLFRASMTSMFLNSEGNYHCSLWPNSNSWPSSLKYFLPSLSRTTCCLCFLFTSLAFLLSLLVIHLHLVLECPKGKTHWTFSLFELSLSSLMSSNTMLWLSKVIVQINMSNLNLWTSQFPHPQSSFLLFSIMPVYRNTILPVVQAEILGVFVNSLIPHIHILITFALP